MFSEFADIIEHRHDVARKWKKRTGNPVMGYFCCVFPEEVLHAAGILPVRIVGDDTPIDMVEGHITRYGCTFCRKCTDLIAQGAYDYLDAVFVSNTCDLVSNLDYWLRELAAPPEVSIAGVPVRSYVNFFNYPQKITGRAAVPYTLNEIRKVRQVAERYTHAFVSDAQVAESLEVYREHQRLMRRVHELRREVPARLSGYEAWMVEYAGLFLPKEEHNRLVQDLLKSLENRSRPAPQGPRLYLSAAAADHVTARLIRLLEECGSEVVSEDVSAHSTYYWSEYPEACPPLEAVARRTLSVPCARSTTSDPFQEMRFQHIRKTLDRYGVQGVVFYILLQCECRASEFPYLREKIESELHLPTLFLDGDYFDADSEKNRIKIEAFLDMIR